ncbi:MAG: lysoplasmalogenase [Terricaulis sp.]
MAFGTISWALCGLGAAAAAAYGFRFVGRAPGLLAAAVKTAFMAAFAAAFALAGAEPLVVVALAASTAGDLFLAFDDKRLVPLGILSFLIAQLAYFFVFLTLWTLAPDAAPLWPRTAAMALVCATSLGFLVWMAPKLGWMALGVVPYALAITAMAGMAFWLPWAGWPAMLGAVSFLVSDFVLAVELFRLPPDAPARRITAPVVWWSYVAAQVLMVAGIALARAAV